eukprot:CFRG3470T1
MARTPTSSTCRSRASSHGPTETPEFGVSLGTESRVAFIPDQNSYADDSGWSLLEQLSLTQAAYRCGMGDMATVSRLMRKIRAPSRPSHFFSVSNCVQQLKHLEHIAGLDANAFLASGSGSTAGIKGSCGSSSTLSRTSSTNIVLGGPSDNNAMVLELSRRLYHARIAEIKKSLAMERENYLRLTREIEMVKAGAFDHHLDTMIQEMHADGVYLAPATTTTPTTQILADGTYRSSAVDPDLSQPSVENPLTIPAESGYWGARRGMSAENVGEGVGLDKGKAALIRKHSGSDINSRQGVPAEPSLAVKLDHLYTKLQKPVTHTPPTADDIDMIDVDINAGTTTNIVRKGSTSSVNKGQAASAKGGRGSRSTSRGPKAKTPPAATVPLTALSRTTRSKGEAASVTDILKEMEARTAQGARLPTSFGKLLGRKAPTSNVGTPKASTPKVSTPKTTMSIGVEADLAPTPLKGGMLPVSDDMKDAENSRVLHAEFSTSSNSNRPAEDPSTDIRAAIEKPATEPLILAKDSHDKLDSNANHTPVIDQNTIEATNVLLHEASAHISSEKCEAAPEPISSADMSVTLRPKLATPVEEKAYLVSNVNSGDDIATCLSLTTVGDKKAETVTMATKLSTPKSTHSSMDAKESGVFVGAGANANASSKQGVLEEKEEKKEQTTITNKDAAIPDENLNINQNTKTDNANLVTMGIEYTVQDVAEIDVKCTGPSVSLSTSSKQHRNDEVVKDEGNKEKKTKVGSKDKSEDSLAVDVVGNGTREVESRGARDEERTTGKTSNSPVSCARETSDVRKQSNSKSNTKENLDEVVADNVDEGDGTDFPIVSRDIDSQKRGTNVAPPSQPRERRRSASAKVNSNSDDSPPPTADKIRPRLSSRSNDTEPVLESSAGARRSSARSTRASSGTTPGSEDLKEKISDVVDGIVVESVEGANERKGDDTTEKENKTKVYKRGDSEETEDEDNRHSPKPSQPLAGRRGRGRPRGSGRGGAAGKVHASSLAVPTPPAQKDLSDTESSSAPQRSGLRGRRRKVDSGQADQDFDSRSTKNTKRQLSRSRSPAAKQSLPQSEDEDVAVDSGNKRQKTTRRLLHSLLRDIMNHKYANTFLKPVNASEAPNYFSIVRRPMDLVSIKKRIDDGTISSAVEFRRDLMLVFTNAMMYNESDHDVYIMAHDMKADVIEQLQMFVTTAHLADGGRHKPQRQGGKIEEDSDEDKPILSRRSVRPSS